MNPFDYFAAKANSSGGGTVTVDDALSESSTNPVQNKAITAALNALPNWDALAEQGRKIKVVAGVIRNSGNGWEFIENATHAKMGFASISADTAAITVNFNFTAKKILGFSVTPDEDFASQGIVCGASVSASSATIKINQRPYSIGGYINYDGSNWVTSNLFGINNVSFSGGGLLTLSHDSLGTGLQFMASVTGRDGAICSLGSCGATTTSFTFRNTDGTIKTTADASMKAYVTRTNRAANINPQTLVSASGNFWILGVFEVD